MQSNKGTAILIGFIIVKIIVQYLLVHPSYDLHRDEYLHLDQARHLAWGFMSVPPLTSWVAWIIKVLGNDSFWVRFFPALFGAGTIYLGWKIAEELGGKLFSKSLVAIAILLSVILRINTLFQPNSFEVFSWTASYYFLIRYVHRERGIDMYIAAIMLVLSFLNKYNVLFLGAGLAAGLLLTSQRDILRRPVFWKAALLFILLISPNVYWQWRNDVPFIRHMQELERTQLVNMQRSTFWKEQLLFFLNSIFLVPLALLAFRQYAPFRKYRFIVIGIITTLLIYTWLRAKGYYSIGLYPVLLAFGAVYLEHLSGERNRWLRPMAIIVVVIGFLPLLLIGFPTSKAEQLADKQRYRELGLLRWEDGKDHHLPQDFADMRGWRELAYITDSAIGLVEGPESVLVLTNNYGQAGAINYYSRRYPGAVAFNADYLQWFPSNQRKHIVRVMEPEHDDDDPQRTQERSVCETLILVGEVRDPMAREKGTRVYLLKNVKQEAWEIIDRERRALLH